jgi:hypothetical protein
VGQTEPAFGVSQGFFYNHLVGARLDYLFTERVSLGPYIGYANLKGPDGGRTNNVLVYLQFEYAHPLSDSGDLSLLFHFGSGYLPKNGPFERVAVGFGYSVSKDLRISLDLFAPAFWVVRDATSISLDMALEVAYRL